MAEQFVQLKKVLADLDRLKEAGLITETDKNETVARLVSSLTFPPTLSAEALSTILTELWACVGDGGVSEAVYQEKKALALSALSLDGARGSGCYSSPLAETQTEEKYFSYYAEFSHQELMLNDLVRTGAYFDAIMGNSADFKDKVVVDVGTGTGVLAMFAARAGARKVYAVEASDMADTARKLVQQNGLAHVVEVVKGKVEDLDLPEKCDIMVSEPLGFWLINEAMIQSYVAGRDKWLKPGGLMFPSYSIMYTAPAFLPDTFAAYQNKVGGWADKQAFYGLDFTPIRELHRQQSMGHIIIDQILPHQVVAPATPYKVDFTTISVQELDDLTLPVKFDMTNAHPWDSIVIWFDTYFHGSPSNPNARTVNLATAPNAKMTCWYQSVALMPNGQSNSTSFEGRMRFIVNRKRTYDCILYGGTPQQNADNHVVAKYSFTNPDYRYYERFAELVADPTGQKWGYEMSSPPPAYSTAAGIVPPPAGGQWPWNAQQWQAPTGADMPMTDDCEDHQMEDPPLRQPLSTACAILNKPDDAPADPSSTSPPATADDVPMKHE